jgi:hypothetical protein
VDVLEEEERVFRGVVRVYVRLCRQRGNWHCSVTRSEPPRS